MSTNAKVAVYGSLRSGHGNSYLLESANFVGIGETKQQEFTMRSMGGFPAVYKGGKNKIVVEVYEVTPEQLGRLDRLEGHPNWYQREVVETTLGPAEMYIMPMSERETILPVIKSGDWNSRHEV